MLCRPDSKLVSFLCTWVAFDPSSNRREATNRIIYLVGLVVIVLFILGYFGLR
jgi:hypothetical protein